VLPDASSILATSTISRRDGPEAGLFFFQPKDLTP